MDFKKNIALWQAKNENWFRSSLLTKDELTGIIQGDGEEYRVLISTNKFKEPGDNKPAFHLFILKEMEKKD